MNYEVFDCIDVYAQFSFLFHAVDFADLASKWKSSTEDIALVRDKSTGDLHLPMLDRHRHQIPEDAGK